MNQRIQSALFVVFGLSMVVSHYGVTYIVLFLLFVMWLILAIAPASGSKLTLPYLRTKTGIHNDAQITALSPRPPPRSLVTIVSVSVLFIASTAWYFYTAQGTVTQQVVTLAGHIAGSVGELFSPTYSQAVNVVAKGPVSGVLHRVNAYINYLNVFFLLVGVCLTVFLKKQRFKLQLSYVVLSTVTLGFLIASVAVPYLGAALNWGRVYQITLIVLAPFLAIGFITIGETAGVTMRKITRKVGFGNLALVSRSRVTQLLAIYLVFFMLLSTGFFFALTEGYQNIELSNQIDGLYNQQTIVGATWQASHSGTIPLSGKSVTIFHYFNNALHNDTTKLTNSDGQITFTQTPGFGGLYSYYATFVGDGSYAPSTSAVVNVNVGSNQSSSQATTNVGSVAQTTTTLSASTTTPAVGRPVTFTATLTGAQVVYGDLNNVLLLSALGLGGQAQVPFYPHSEIAGGASIFLGTHNIEHNEVLLFNFTGVNVQSYYANVTPLISSRSLIYSNGGASVYS